MKKSFITQKPNTEKNYFIDVLKMVAILCVIIHHVVWTNPTSPKSELLGFPFWAYQGVPIFLLLSGYLWSKSYEKHFEHFYEAYYPIYLLKKCIRFFLPYVGLYILEVILSASNGTISQHDWLTLFFAGGIAGYGHYYFAMLAQLLILMPVIYFLIKKFNWYAMAGIYIFNVLFEVFRWGINLNIYIYEYLVFRWLVVIAYGVWLSLNDKKKQNIPLSIIAFVIGLGSLIWLFYTPYTCVFFYDQNWKHANFLTLFYIVPICGLLIRKCKINIKWVGLIGRASYSFYISQILVLIFAATFGFTANNVGNVFLWLLFIFIIGFAFYYLIEILCCNNLVKLISNKQRNNKTS